MKTIKATYIKIRNVIIYSYEGEGNLHSLHTASTNFFKAFMQNKIISRTLFRLGNVPEKVSFLFTLVNLKSAFEWSSKKDKQILIIFSGFNFTGKEWKAYKLLEWVGYQTVDEKVLKQGSVEVMEPGALFALVLFLICKGCLMIHWCLNFVFLSSLVLRVFVQRSDDDDNLYEPGRNKIFHIASEHFKNSKHFKFH